MPVSYKIVTPRGVPLAQKSGLAVKYASRSIALRCPHCMHMGTFQVAPIEDVAFNSKTPDGKSFSLMAGIRICPNVECHGAIFVVHENYNLLLSFPPETIDFDASSLPGPVLSCLEEAISCEAHENYRASVLMVRRTLEELCENKQITGKDLKERLEELGKTIVIPPALITGAAKLRLMGNDAAHIKSKTYDKVEAAECKAAIKFVKLLLQAVYQYDDALADLESLEKPAT